MEAATVPLVADRWTPFVHTIEYQGEDLNLAAVFMHVRLTPDAPGSPLVILSNTNDPEAEGIRFPYAGTATIAEHIAAGRMSEIPEGYSGTDSLALTLLTIRINEPSVEAMPFPAERGSDAKLAYDIHVTPVGGLKQVYFRGPFTVRAGVTV